MIKYREWRIVQVLLVIVSVDIDSMPAMFLTCLIRNSRGRDTI